MIVPMKKATIVFQAKDAVGAVKRLRSLGLLHVEHHNIPKGDDIDSVRGDIALIDEAIATLPKEKGLIRRKTVKYIEAGYWRVAARYLHNLYSRLKQLEQHSYSLKNEIEQWEPWGDFDPLKVEELEKRGFHIRLYRIPQSELKKISLPEGAVMESVGAKGGVADVVIMSREVCEIPFKSLTLPKRGVTYMRARLAENETVMGQIKGALQACAGFRYRFLAIKKDLSSKLVFNEVMKGMGGDGPLSYVTGYVPCDSVDTVRAAAGSEKWAILIADPSEEDNIPTLVRNPGWISIIKPVFRLLEIVPGYHELDISLWFLFFFSVFFGMLIGDAGYGLIYLSLTIWAHHKFGKKMPDASLFILLYVLCACAVTWGILTGTFFGQSWLKGLVKPLLPALAEDRNVQTLCFFIGALHLSIAHGWRALLKSPSLAALADIGWISILWGGFFLARLLVLGLAFPDFAKWLFIAGMALVVFFSAPNKNILRCVGSGLGTLALSLVNSFTDVVSYIRLFAVGLAGVAVADAFNSMAMSVGFNGVISGIVTALILFLGHTLNIILGPMSVIVHGVRLNVLEFCGHVDVKWRGFPYSPLKEEKNS